MVTKSIDLLFDKTIFDKEISCFNSKIGAENKKIKKPRSQAHIRYTKNFTTFSNSSKNLFYKRSLIYNSKYDFSEVFNFFVKHIDVSKLQINDDTKMLIDYINIWKNEKNDSICSIDDLKSSGIRGYMKHSLQPIANKKKLDKILIKDKEYYIKSGVFIMSQSKSLLNQNFKIDGFLLDTTWRVLSNYVTCFLTACFCNSSIPIAFAFGHGETVDLYEFLLKTISKQLQIDFTNAIFEADQGPSLISICQEYKIKQLFCLRHLIHSFNMFEFILNFDFYYFVIFH